MNSDINELDKQLAGLQARAVEANDRKQQQQQQLRRQANDDDDRGDANHQHGDWDDDGASDSSDSCYDPLTGNEVVTDDMSPERRARILAREEEKKRALTEPIVDVRLSPPKRRRTRAELRAMSEQALSEARQVIAADLNEPCPIVRDPESGLLLPRESLVSHAKPIEVVGEDGETFLVPAPVTGFVGEEDDPDFEVYKKKVLEENTRQHYASSLAIVEQLRMKRLANLLENA